MQSKFLLIVLLYLQLVVGSRSVPGIRLDCFQSSVIKCYESLSYLFSFMMRVVEKLRSVFTVVCSSKSQEASGLAHLKTRHIHSNERLRSCHVDFKLAICIVHIHPCDAFASIS